MAKNNNSFYQSNVLYIDKDYQIIYQGDIKHEEDRLLKIEYLYNQPIKDSLLDKLFNQDNSTIDEFRFAVINIDNEDKLRMNEIIDFFENVVGDLDYVLINNQLVIFYFEKYFFDFKTILDPLTEDIGTNLEIFEGCKISNKEDFFFMVWLYFEYLNRNFYRYASLCDLVLKLYQEDYQKIKVLKKIILQDVLEDNQLVNLINSMFENNLNVSQSSTVVYMHRNTVNNKLELIKRLTGLNIQTFKEAVAMYLLLNA